MKQSKKQGKQRRRHRHSCTLCSRRFPSGRALAGHMRAHAAASDVSTTTSSSSPLLAASHPELPPMPPPPSSNATEEEAAWALVRLAGDAWPRRRATGKEAFVCPFCGRAFASGQALGGHKRSHRSSSSASPASAGIQCSIGSKIPCLR